VVKTALIIISKTESLIEANGLNSRIFADFPAGWTPYL